MSVCNLIRQRAIKQSQLQQLCNGSFRFLIRHRHLWGNSPQTSEIYTPLNFRSPYDGVLPPDSCDTVRVFSITRRCTCIYRPTVLTSFRLELELCLDGVVSAVQQAAVDGERSQLSIQLQLAVIVLSMTLHERLLLPYY